MFYNAAIPSSFMKLEVYGATDDQWNECANLITLSGIATTTGGLFDTAPTDKTDGAVNATLRVNVGGVAYYLPLWDNADGS